jgi:hypothetical protein
MCGALGPRNLAAADWQHSSEPPEGRAIMFSPPAQGPGGTSQR